MGLSMRKISSCLHRGLLPVAISLMIVAIIIQLPYLINMVTITTESIVNQIKWKINGSPNYIIRTDLNDFTPFRGINTVTVQNGEIVEVEGDRGNTFSYSPNFYKHEDYSIITIEGMFQNTYKCVFQPSLNYWLNRRPGNNPYDPNFLWLSCKFSYDPKLGYPTRVEIRCSNADICSREIDVLEVRILPNER
jgi:hypothetical protein